jgi:pimeloyl-ACP methyl ester carboxylesterase
MWDRFVEVNGLHVRYRSAGERGPVLVLLHGIGRMLEDWSENILVLGRSHRVFALDFPGCGFSDKPNLPYTTLFLTGFVRDFLRALNLERATLIGNSMGGGIGLEFSVLFPELLEGLVLVAPAGMGPKGAQFLALCSIPIFGELISRPSRVGSKRVLGLLFADRTMMTQARAERDFERSSQPGATRAFLKMLRFMANRHGVKPAFYGRSLENAAKVSVSTLIVWGVQDQILPVEYAPVAGRVIPGSRLQIYDPCGHFPMLERALEFNALLLEFWKLSINPHKSVSRQGGGLETQEMGSGLFVCDLTQCLWVFQGDLAVASVDYALAGEFTNDFGHSFADTADGGGEFVVRGENHQRAVWSRGGEGGGRQFEQFTGDA